MPEPSKPLPVEKPLGPVTLHANGTLTPKDAPRFDPREHSSLNVNEVLFESNENEKGLRVAIKRVGKKTVLLHYREGTWYQVPLPNQEAESRTQPTSLQTAQQKAQQSAIQATRFAAKTARNVATDIRDYDYNKWQPVLEKLDTKQGILIALSVVIGINLAIILLASLFKGEAAYAEGFGIFIMGLFGYGLVKLLVAIYKYFTTSEEQQQHTRRGRTLITHAIAEANANRLREPDDRGVWWGKIRIPSEEATVHFCVVGAVGSGKTLTLRMLMQDQLPNVKSGSNVRAMIYDSKQDMLPILASLGLSCPVHILNPFDKRATAWDMAKDIQTPAAAREFASTLVPEVNESQPFFVDQVRDLLTCVVTVFSQNSPGTWTFRDVLLTMRSKERLLQTLRSHPSTRHKVEEILQTPETTMGSIRSTIGSKLGSFEPIAAAWEHAEKKISIRDWFQGESILVLGNDETIRTSLDRVNQLFVSVASQQALSMPDSTKRRTWFFFDEFREAGKLDGLNSLVVRGRSKGCCVVLGFQDIQGLHDVYGENVANEMVGQCGNKALLRLESPETADWASKVISDAEFIEETKSHTDNSGGNSSTTTNQSRVVRAQVLPAEFLSLPVTNRQNGLHGVYAIRSVGVYKDIYSPEELTASLWPENNDFHANVPSPPEWQFVTEWTKDDAVRLGLNGELPSQNAPGRNGQEQQTDIPDGLDSIGRMERDN